MDDVTKTGGYWEQKEEALDRTVWRTGFGIGYGHVVKTDYRKNEQLCRSLQRLKSSHTLLDVTTKRNREFLI